MCVIKGEAKLVLCDISTKKTTELILSDQNLKTIKVLPNIAHGIKNIGKEMMYLLIYSDMVFDPENPDTFEYRCII
ncbi:MAG: hypothetical protein ACE5KT_12405 [Methanosarcinales archaeon]